VFGRNESQLHHRDETLAAGKQFASGRAFAAGAIASSSVRERSIQSSEVSWVFTFLHRNQIFGRQREGPDNTRTVVKT
jgi:hypothetical protein